MTRSACPSPASASAHPADRFFSIDGVRLRYRDEGHGLPLLLVHGWTLDLEMWNPQVQELRYALRMVRVDRRGFGHSSGIPAPARDASDLAALCRHLGLERVALLGMSQGVRSVLDFAISTPEAVSAIILDGPPTFEQSAADDDVPIARYQGLIRSDGIEAFRREWARHPLTQLYTHDKSAHALLATMLERYTGRDLACPNERATPSNLSAGLQLLTVPALVINGEFDVPSRLQAAGLACSLLRSSQRALIPAAGHLPNLDNPAVYNKLCQAFLSQHANSRNPSGSSHV